MNVLAADVGGTNIRVGVVDAEGSIAARGEVSTPPNGSPEMIASALAELSNHLTGENSIAVSSFGLAIPGVIDFSSGHVSRSPNLPQLNRVEFGRVVEEATGLPVVLENDATAAAIGEHWLGAARGFSNAICITLGTGIGGGLIINGSPFAGADGTAGEVGHICVEPEGHPCGCGSRGCVEQYASATAIVRIANEGLDGGTASKLGDKPSFSSKDVFESALDGDAFALTVFGVAGRYLGIACADLVNVLNPEVIVFTGGLSASMRVLMGPMLDEMKKRAYQQPAERVKLVRGELGDDAGILGAAKQAFAKAYKRNSIS